MPEKYHCILLGDEFVVLTKNELTSNPVPRPTPTRREVQAWPPVLRAEAVELPQRDYLSKEADLMNPERSSVIVSESNGNLTGGGGHLPQRDQRFPLSGFLQLS